MKKFAAALALVSMCTTSAFAGGVDTVFTSVEAYEADQQTFELEPGAMSQADLQPLTGDVDKSRGDDVVAGIIIGGIIGLIAADALDRDDHYHHRPHRPHRQVVCYAQNARGQMFRAYGRRARPVQDAAMNKCFNHSRRCRPAGCQVY